MVVDITGKGRGVKASRPFSKGDFVVEYAGEVMDAGSGHAMEATYSMDMTKGSYSYYFLFNSKNFCLDATEESGRYGRLCPQGGGGCWHPKVDFPGQAQHQSWPGNHLRLWGQKQREFVSLSLAGPLVFSAPLFQ